MCAVIGGFRVLEVEFTFVSIVFVLLLLCGLWGTLVKLLCVCVGVRVFGLFFVSFVPTIRLLC